MNAHTPILQPLGMPKGMDPRQWRQSVEKRLNDLLDRTMSLITALDLMEVDYDLPSDPREAELKSLTVTDIARRLRRRASVLPGQ